MRGLRALSRHVDRHPQLASLEADDHLTGAIGHRADQPGLVDLDSLGSARFQPGVGRLVRRLAVRSRREDDQALFCLGAVQAYPGRKRLQARRPVLVPLAGPNAVGPGREQPDHQT